MEILPIKQLTKYRVVEGFSQFRLRVELQINQIMLFYLLPQSFIEAMHRQFLLQCSNSFADSGIVIGDPLGIIGEKSAPVCRCESLLGIGGNLLK